LPQKFTELRGKRTVACTGVFSSKERVLNILPASNGIVAAILTG